MSQTKVGSAKNLEAVYPLSPTQQGLLFQYIYGQSWEYFQQMSYSLSGALNCQNLKAALERVIERHQVLRTVFLWERIDKPIQIVRKRMTLPWAEFDWQELAQEEQETRFNAFLCADRDLGFDISKGPLIRLTLIRLSDERYRFIWSHHHIILDGWSAALLRGEVFTYYHAYCRGIDLQMPEPRPFRDYIKWLQRQDLSKAEAYWRETLKGFTAATPLVLSPAKDTLSNQDDEYLQWGSKIPDGVITALQTLVRQNRLTVSTVVKGFWALLLSHYSGREDVIFGSVYSGRPYELARVESMVGVFITTLPIRVQISLDLPLLKWLSDLQYQQALLQEYEYTPLSEIHGWSEIGRGQSLFESVLVFQNFPQDVASRHEGVPETNSGLKISDSRLIIRNNYPLTLRVEPDFGNIVFLYDSRRFASQAIIRTWNHLNLLFTYFVEHPHTTLRAMIREIDEYDRRLHSAQYQEFKALISQKLGGVKRKSIIGSSIPE